MNRRTVLLGDPRTAPLFAHDQCHRAQLRRGAASKPVRGVFANLESVDRIIYAILNRFHEN